MYEIDELSKILNSFQFEALESALWGLPFEKMVETLDLVAYNNQQDESNLLVYTYLLYIIGKDENWEWHFIASKIMGLSLNHIQSAERLGVYHGLKAIELNPSNLDIKEYLLYYNQIPEKELDDKTAIEIAEEILKVRPESIIAQVAASKRNQWI